MHAEIEVAGSSRGQRQFIGDAADGADFAEVRFVGVDFAAFDLAAADGRYGLVQGLQFTAEYALAVEEGATVFYRRV